MTSFRRGLGLLVLLLCIPVPAFAQFGWLGYEQTTIDATAGGVPLPASMITDSSHMNPSQAFCTVEGANIRWTVDGTAPTSSAGFLALDGNPLPAIQGTTLLSNFRAIRTAGVSAALRCFYVAGGSLPFREWNPPLTASGGGGSFNGVLLDAASGDPVTDTANNAINVAIVAGGGTGGTAIADDADFVDGTTVGTPVGGVAESASPTTVTEGDFGWLAMTLNRALKTSLFNAAGTAAFGTAGTAAAPVLTVQGIASMTPLLTTATVSDGAGALNAIIDSGTLTAVTSITNTVNTIGTIANDAGAAATNRLPTLPGITENAAPSRTDGRNAAFSFTLGGAARMMLTNAAGAAQTLAADVTEDAAETAGGTGPMVMSVRRDTAASSAGTTGDNATLNTDASGRLWVNCGTGCSGGTQYAEDLAHTSTDSTFFVSGIRRDTTPSSSAGTAGDYAALNLDANGRLYTNATFYDAAGAALTPATDVVEDAAETPGGTGPAVMSVRRDAPASSAGTTGDNATLNTSALGAVYTATIDPCSYRAKSFYVVNISTATTVEIANAVASEFWHVCAVNLVAGAAQTIAIGHDDTDGCGSITAGMHGGATAATGWSFAANGGITLGNGNATVLKSATANHYFCVITGQATQISGTISYVSAP